MLVEQVAESPWNRWPNRVECAYYPTPDADPYILDNLTDKLLRASQRDDLEPVYSFNDEDLWAVGANGFKAKSSQIRLWSELLQKMEKERAM